MNNNPFSHFYNCNNKLFHSNIFYVLADGTLFLLLLQPFSFQTKLLHPQKLYNNQYPAHLCTLFVLPIIFFDGLPLKVEAGKVSPLGGLMDTIRLDVTELDLFAEISQEGGGGSHFFGKEMI